MNKWFAAHIVMYVEFKTESQTTFPVWENIVLINANSDDEAFGKAERKGLESEGDDGGSFEWEGLPARWVFAGVRKLTLCKNSEERPGDGTEITYIQMRVRSKNSLKKLVKSDRVNVELIEPFAEEEEPPRAYLVPDRDLVRPSSIRTLLTHQDAMDFLREHARQIERAVIIPYAFLYYFTNGHIDSDADAGMVLHLSNGKTHFLNRKATENLLNEGVLANMKIKIELPR